LKPVFVVQILFFQLGYDAPFLDNTSVKYTPTIEATTYVTVIYFKYTISCSVAQPLPVHIIIIIIIIIIIRGRDSSFGVATGYALDGPALGPTRFQRVPGALSPEVKAAGGVKVTTHFHLVPRSRMVKLYLHSPICLLGIVLN
jgi:hypothetical protein